MTRVVQFMRDLVAKGMSWEDAAMFAERFESDLKTAVDEAVALARPVRSAGAERQARFRANREAERARDVTCDVTSSVTPLSEGSQGSPEPPPNPPNLSQEPPISPKKRVSRAKTASDFEVFWAAYPRKVAKGDAERAFPKALAQTTLETLTEAARAMARAAEDVKFIPYPASWLNGKRWLDTTDPPEGHGCEPVDLAKIDADRARIRAMFESEETAA